MRGAGLAVSAVWLGMATPAAAIDAPKFEQALHRALGQPATAPGKGGVNELTNRANGTLGMPGTDLGVSFDSRGRLYFLFAHPRSTSRAGPWSRAAALRSTTGSR